MPIYTRVEFAELCGVKAAYVTVNIGRGKVVLDKNGNVNTKDPYNNEFMIKRIATLKNEVITPEEKPIAPAAAKKKKPLPKQKGDTSRDADDPDDSNADSSRKYNLDIQIKELEIEKKTEEVRKLKLSNAKMVGETIPMDIVLLTMEHHFRSVSSEFYNAADNFIGTITARLGAPKKEVAHIRKELIDIVNKSIQDGIKTSKKDVKKISQVYAEKRSKGESK